MNGQRHLGGMISVAVVGLGLAAGLQAAEPVEVPWRNPSFEAGMDGPAPAGWRLYAGGRTGQSLTVVSPPFAAGQALLLDDRDAAAELGIQQEGPATGGQAYQAAVDVAALAAAPPPTAAFLQMRFLPSNTFVQRNLHTRSTAGFETLTLTGAMPATDTAIRLYLYTHKGPAQTTILLDNVRLVAGVTPPAEESPLPPMKAPPVTQLKDLHLTTPLVRGGAATVALVVPAGRYGDAAALLQEAVRAATGVLLPILQDTDAAAALPLGGHRIVLGNRSTNRLAGALYTSYFTLVDLKYPGLGGAVVQSVHNPGGNGHNAILVGGSDDAGVMLAATVLAERVRAAPRGDGLALGWVLDVRLPEGVELPADARQAETWDASDGYGSVGYFGWNSLSKCMAMYLMTGNEVHARELLRLAFPDAQARQEIAEIDGERIENKDDPLAGAYHYNQHLTTLFWDLIEESPVFTDAERLRVTNALARQVEHPDYAREGIFRLRAPAAAVGSRHGQWAAIGLLCLGRYFQRDYPDPVWEQCERAAKLAFASLHEHAWVSGESDNLFWYSTGVAPILTYLCLTGDRVPVRNGIPGELLRGQEILLSGMPGDRHLRHAAISFLNQAAFLTGDGRWVHYRQRTGMGMDVFRLGQSYWPEEDLPPQAPADLAGQWSVQRLPVPLWLGRHSGIPLEDSFFFGSFRSETGADGDYVLLDGFNGASRNPYHTLAVLDLRLAGTPLLQGYRNQVLTRADGMVEPAVAMDAALRGADCLGGTAFAVGEVPRAAFCTWRRTLVQRLGSYALIVDDLTFRESSDNLAADILWETVGARWSADRERADFAAGAASAVPEGWRGFSALEAQCSTLPDTPGRLARLPSLGIVLLRADGPGECLDMPFRLEQPFIGTAFLDTLRYRDRGVVRVRLGGEILRDRVSLHAEDATPERIPLGAVSLAAGEHVLRLEVVEPDGTGLKAFAALAGLLLQPANAASAPGPAAAGFALSTADPLAVTGSGAITMSWAAPVRAGEQVRLFHLLARSAGSVPGSAAQRLSANAAVLRLPEAALAVCGSHAGTQAEAAVVADGHLFGLGLRAAGFGTPLVQASHAVSLDWDFAAGTVHVNASQPTALALAVADPAALRLAGIPVAGVPLDLPAGRHRITGATIAPAAAAELRSGLAQAETQAAKTWQQTKAARQGDTAFEAPALALREVGRLPQAPADAIAFAAPDGGVRLAAACGSEVHLMGAAGETARRFAADAAVRVLSWWPDAGVLLAGCADEQLIAFGLDGTRRWVFTSEMDPAVFRAAKTYWFKSAPGHGGIHGLATGLFSDGRSQCLVGSACTLEIVNADGTLAHRLPVFWGPGKIIRIVEGAAGNPQGLIARWPNGTDELSIVDSRDRSVRRGFYGVPAGHTMVGGWSAQNRVDLIWEDINADGEPELVTAINGTWNRVGTYDRQGRPLHSASFGPGAGNTFRAWIRDLKTAPWSPDGRRVILVATHSGLVTALDHACGRLWSRALPSAPRRLLVDGDRVLVGCDDASVVVLGCRGEVVSAARVGGRVEFLLALPSGECMVLDAAGGVSRID